MITDSDFGPNGGMLYKIKESATGVLNETTRAFREKLNNRGPNWVSTGYVRKSITKETDETTRRLLQLMITKLQNRCFCSLVFAFPEKSGIKADYGKGLRY